MHNRQEYSFASVANPQYLSLDIGIKVVALGLCHGAFHDYSTLDQLLQGDNVQLTWNSSFLEHPFFCHCGLAGASMDYNKLMTDENLWIHMDQCCQRVGLIGAWQPDYYNAKLFWVWFPGKEFNNMTYNFHWWTLTEVICQGNSEMAKSLVHHSHVASTAVEVYLFQVITMDLVQIALLGQDNMDCSKALDLHNAASVFRWEFMLLYNHSINNSLLGYQALRKLLFSVWNRCWSAFQL